MDHSDNLETLIITINNSSNDPSMNDKDVEGNYIFHQDEPKFDINTYLIDLFNDEETAHDSNNKEEMKETSVSHWDCSSASLTESVDSNAENNTEKNSARHSEWTRRSSVKYVLTSILTLSTVKETFLETDDFQSQTYFELKSVTESESETYKETITEKDVSKWLAAIVKVGQVSWYASGLMSCLLNIYTGSLNMSIDSLDSLSSTVAD